jgi:Tol biopolymer transport system component/DNA-binding winged helix-turn-helix (wHTH) protein
MPSEVYEFGDVTVDLRRMAVLRNGAPVSVEPKAFDVLRFLIEHRDRVVTKDELLDVVWKDTFVTPNVLTRAVAQLRKALGDAAFEARYVETVAKRGYRFIAVVTTPPHGEVAAPPTLPAPATPPRLLSRWPRMTFGALMALAALALVATLRLGGRAETTMPAAAPKQLTTRGGYNGMPAISVDGSRVAYVSDRTGRFEIYLTTPHVGGTDAALTSDGQDNLEPAWSPDGQWLAYHSARRGGIWTVRATGGAPQQIVEVGASPSWSPDGEHIVYVSGSETSSLHSLVWAARRDGSDRRPVTASGRPAGGHRSPSWSHDGRYVVFASTDHSGVEIWLLRLSDRRLSRLIGTNAGQSHFPHFTPGTTAVFAPGDRAVYATGFAEGGNARVWRLPIDAERGAAAGPLEAVVPLNNEIIESLSISQNGTLVYGVNVQDANIWAVDVPVNGSPGEPVRLTDDSVRDTLPRFAPDGRIAYQQFTIGGGSTLAWLMRKDGSGRQPLIGDAGYAFPQWSPDGTRVLVARATAKPNDREMCWVDVDTRRVVGTGVHIGPTMPHLSPDGARFAFFRIEPDGSINVWTQALDGGPARRITSSVSASYPAWSPDARWLAVELEHGADSQLGVVAASGGSVEQLTTDPGLHFVFAWAPDGDRLTYAGNRDGVWNISTVSRRTRKIAALTHFTSPNGYVRYPVWSPQGDRVVFERAIDNVTLWTVQMRER